MTYNKFRMILTVVIIVGIIGDIICTGILASQGHMPSWFSIWANKSIEFMLAATLLINEYIDCQDYEEGV